MTGSAGGFAPNSAATLRFGSQAIGGVVNLITESGSEMMIVGLAVAIALIAVAEAAARAEAEKRAARALALLSDAEHLLRDVVVLAGGRARLVRVAVAGEDL